MLEVLRFIKDGTWAFIKASAYTAAFWLIVMVLMVTLYNTVAEGSELSDYRGSSPVEVEPYEPVFIDDYIDEPHLPILLDAIDEMERVISEMARPGISVMKACRDVHNARITWLESKVEKLEQRHIKLLLSLSRGEKP